MKVIAIQQGLENIKRDLQSFGYKVVGSDEITGPVDAFVYYENTNTQYLCQINHILNNQASMSTVNGHNAGTLLINAKGKSSHDIRDIIEQRLYSPLF